MDLKTHKPLLIKPTILRFMGRNTDRDRFALDGQANGCQNRIMSIRRCLCRKSDVRGSSAATPAIHRSIPWTLGPTASLGVALGLACLICLAMPGSTWADDVALRRHGQRLDAQFRQQFIPYWYDTTVDHERGGYLLADDLRGRRQATEKQLVSQARMVWSFAHFHLKGVRDPQRDLLAAARQGYRFLVDRLRDREHGGYYWKTDLAGQPTAQRKILYGQAFVVYALVEYYRASGDAEALRHALDLYRTIQRRARDGKHGGWIEHFERDWQPVLRHDDRIEVEVGGYKSANAHLHWMEALAELYQETRDREVRQSLVEAIAINRRYFYPPDAGKSCFHRQLDWKPVTDPKSAGLSYGHNVEFAWLMVRAQQVLGQRPAWKHFYAHLDHALEHGYDHARGGLYNRGVGDAPAHDTAKVWWVQAEMMAVLTDALRHRPHARYERALVQLFDFVEQYQGDPRDGIWLDTVTAEGQPKSTGKAHSWKAAYHDGRAFVKFLETFTWTRPPR
jgi:mannobiose 2-epimerase